jgi:DNA-binding NarL/FixJ family response regulator
MMKACVFTVDQRSSRTTADLVPAAVREHGSGALLAFERTAGDEMQAVFTDPSAAARTIKALLRAGTWNIGIGTGEVEEPLPASARAGRGTAYLHAREAVNTAKNAPGRIAVVGAVGARGHRARHLETVVWLWAGLLTRRTDRGWEVADLVAQGMTHTEAAERLGISQSAVSQRAQAAGLVEGERALELVTEMLTEMLTDDTD